jgi:hypothetical protein
MPETTLTPAEFIKAGEELFGEDWREAMVDEVEISIITIWRYASGKYPIPRKVELAIKGLLLEKQNASPEGWLRCLEARTKIRSAMKERKSRL